MARAVRGASGIVTIFPALAEHRECAVAAFESERFDVGAERFGHAQAVDREQRHERVLAGRGEAGCDEQRADLVAIQADGMGLVVEPRATNVHRGRSLEKSFLLGVAVEAGDGAQPPGGGGASAAAFFEVAGVTLDVRAADREPAQVVGLAPGDELAQVQGVGAAGEAAVAG
jgi:hypothetical protein